MEKLFRDMDGQFTQDAAVLRNAIKELKMRAGAIGPETTGLSQNFQSKKISQT